MDYASTVPIQIRVGHGVPDSAVWVHAAQGWEAVGSQVSGRGAPDVPQGGGGTVDHSGPSIGTGGAFCHGLAVY